MHHVLCSYVVGIELFRFQWLFLWFGVSINSWIHSALLCTQGFEFALPMSNMLCWVTQTKPCLSMNQCCASQSTSANLLLYLRDMLSCQGPSHSFIVSLIYLEPASLLITHHSSMPSRGFGKFTWLGLLRGCLKSLAFLIRLLVLWFLEWILIKFLQNSSGCFYLPHGMCLVWWLPITFIHGTYPLLSSTLLWVVHPQLIMLKMLYTNLYWVFLCFALGLIRLCAAYW